VYDASVAVNVPVEDEIPTNATTSSSACVVAGVAPELTAVPVPDPDTTWSKSSTPENSAAIIDRSLMDVSPVTVIVSPAKSAVVTVVWRTCPPVVAVDVRSIVYVFPRVSVPDTTVPTPFPLTPTTRVFPTGTPPVATVAVMPVDAVVCWLDAAILTNAATIKTYRKNAVNAPTVGAVVPNAAPTTAAITQLSMRAPAARVPQPESRVIPVVPVPRTTDAPASVPAHVDASDAFATYDSFTAALVVPPFDNTIATNRT
jgi:hypothetical protein